MELFGKFVAWILVIAFGFFAAILSANLFSTLWGWFVVPLGLHEIGPAQAYGLIILVGYLNSHTVLQLAKLVGKIESDETPLAKAAVSVFTSYVFMGMTFGLSWIVHSL